MWSQAYKMAQKAASNPKLQGLAVAVGGLLMWKAMDVYDTQAQKEIAEADIKMRALELEETCQARIDENRRHTEDIAMRERELNNKEKG